MKVFLTSIFIFFSLFFLHQNQTYAAATQPCTTLGIGNHCTIFKCANGDEPGGSCSNPLTHCCIGKKLSSPDNYLCGANNDGVQTAIGCISFDFESGDLIKSILNISIGLGGGIALLLMLYGTFIITTSAGIPDKLNQGKEIITSAATGLVFIILSIVLMNLIGVTILGIPGL